MSGGAGSTRDGAPGPSRSGKYGRPRRSYLDSDPVGGVVVARSSCLSQKQLGKLHVPEGGEARCIALLERLYERPKGLSDDSPVPPAASGILRDLIEEKTLDSRYTEDNLPCSLQAFASAFTSKPNIRKMYKFLVEAGLNVEDARGPAGGVDCASFVKALQDWERWASKRAKQRGEKIRGLDVHFLKCNGGTLLDYQVMHKTTLLAGGEWGTQVIVYVEDAASGFVHYCASKGVSRGSDKEIFRRLNARKEYSESTSDCSTSDTSSRSETVPVPRAGPSGTAPAVRRERALEGAVIPTLGVPVLERSLVLPDFFREKLTVAISRAQGMDPPVEDEGSWDDEPIGRIGPSDPEPDDGGGPPGFPVSDHDLKHLHTHVEFIKTHNTTPILDYNLEDGEIEAEFRLCGDLFGPAPTRRKGSGWVNRVRAYECGGLVSEGCVSHDDASYEGGVGLTELHPTVLDRFNFTKNSFYYVTRGIEPDNLDGKLLSNGQYNPLWLSSMQFENMSYELDYIGFHGPCDYYRLRKAAHLIPKTGLLGCPDVLRTAWDETTAWFADIGLTEQPRAQVKHATNMPGRGLRPKRLVGSGASRARWAINAQYAREDLRGPYHTLFVKNADDDNLDPTEALVALTSEKAQLEAKFGKRGYRPAKLSGFKNCGSCGNEPPKQKYKWKHRVCNECDVKLKKCGSVSTMGQQIQMNMTVAEGHPGRVHLYSSTLPPKPEKWAKVDIPEGKIKMRKTDAPWLKPVGADRKTWHSVVKEDLAKIDTSLEQSKQECVLAGIGVSGCYPMVTRKGPYSRMQALIGRAFLKKPKSSPAAWAVMDKFKDELLPSSALDGEKMPIDAWLASMPARRRRALERAYREYINDGGLTDKDLTFSAFVKQELLASYKKFDWADAKPLAESIARMIMAPKDKAHIVAGPVIKPKLERLKAHWNKDNWLFYGATTPEKLQGWLDSSVAGCEDGDVFAFWCDYSMFDCTHSKESMRLVESFYSEMRSDPEFARLINAWRAPKGKMGEMDYQADIMLASGRDDTSLMNAILNGLVMGLSVAAAVAGVRLEDLQKEHLRYAEAYIRISICGDDTLGFLPKHLWGDRVRIMREIERNISRFGLVTKLDCTDYLGSAVYLGMRPYNVPTPTGRRWLWGRTVGRAAFKFGWMLDLAKGDAAAWATGVADSVARTQPYVPILSDLARRTLKLREGARRTPVAVDENKPWTNWTVQQETKDLTYDRQTLYCLEKSYSTPTLYGEPGPICTPSVEDFLCTVRKIESIPCMPYVVDDMALRFMCVTDDC